MKPETTEQDSGLIQRGLLLLGGMTALVVVVLLIVLRGPDTPSKSAPRREALLLPIVVAAAPFPAAPNWSTLAQLQDQLPSAPGWQIRYNAALALARRGSPNTPWLIIHEMLDEERQLRNFRVALKGGASVPNEEEAQHAVRNALAAVAQWHKKQEPNTSPSADLQLVYERIDRLAQDRNTVLRVQADRTRQTFFRKPAEK